MKKLFCPFLFFALMGILSFSFVGCDKEDVEALPDYVVKVDANGNATKGHRFTKIDDSNFFIDNISYRIIDDALMVTGYNKLLPIDTANIISELLYKGRRMKVTSICDMAFGNCTTLTSVTLPSTLKRIMQNAFQLCTALTSITLPESAVIENAAFIGCHNLATITIPKGITEIRAGVFKDCTSLTSVTIPSSVTSIWENAFKGCISLSSLTFFEGTTNIGDYAFQDCSSLTSVTFPESVTSIGAHSFSRCTSLTTISIPSSIGYIGERAFASCTGLKDVYCYAEILPRTEAFVFDGIDPTSSTLHVPALAIDNYNSNWCWKPFGSIVAL